ncbi:MAG: hypothetical protein Fur0021_27220 [Candidatus Promineifilaceae bacterium]
MRNAIFLQVKEILSKINGQIDAGRELTLDTKWRDLGMDSLQTIDFIVAVEDSFDFVIPDDDLLIQDQWMKTLGSIVSYIQQHIHA